MNTASPWTRRAARRFVATSALVVLASLPPNAPPSAREASAPDAGTPDAGTQAAGAAAPDGESPLPEELLAPIDPFSAGPTLEAHRLRGLTAEVVGLILQHDPGGDFAFEALATPLRGEGGKAFVPLFIEIDGPTFLEANQSATARVEVYAYALGARRQVAGFLAEVFAVNVQKLGEAVWQSGLKYYGHLDLPPGRYTLRVLIRNYQSGAAALRELALDVPDFKTRQEPYLLSPVFSPPASRDVWLPVRESEAPGDGYPFLIEGRAVSPMVRPVLVAGRRVEAHLLADGVPPGHPQGRIELQHGGATLASRALEIVPLPDKVRGFTVFAVAFESPRVDPGVYSLRAHLHGGAVSEPATVVVLHQDTKDRSLLWTDLRGRLGDGARPPGEEVEEVGTAPPDAEKKVSEAAKLEEQRRIQDLAARYRGALAGLGRGQRAAARSALLDLESAVLTDGSLKTMQTAQLLVAEQLAAGDVESLIPVLVLHDDLYATYRQRHLFSLGFNAREMIETLAELYAQRGATEGSKVVAARVLASLGGHLQEANLPSSSRRLYRRALEHDPKNLAALLGLAISFERYAEYPRAVEVLEKLGAAHPGFGEGSLRLAINLDRLGQRGRCRELLERALEPGTPDWVRSLAYQKLARIALEVEDLETATRLLEQSLEEIPDQHGTVFLLAHVYDRQRAAKKALALLHSIVAAAGGDDSARKRYDGWPVGVLEAQRKQLSDAAEVRMALVGRILGAQEGTPP